MLDHGSHNIGIIAINVVLTSSRIRPITAEGSTKNTLSLLDYRFVSINLAIVEFEDDV